MANWLSSADAVILFTGNVVLNCNEAALKLFAYENKEQLLSQGPIHLLLPQQPDSLSATERLMMLTGQAQQEGFYRGAVVGKRADGSGFYVNLVIIPEAMPGCDGIYYCTKWLPIRTFELGQALPEQQMWQASFLNTTTGILEINKGGKILECNDTFCSWLGYEPHELEHWYMHELLHDPQSFSQLRELVTESPLTPKVSLVLRAREGKILLFKATARQLDSGHVKLFLKQFQQQEEGEHEFFRLEIERLKQENQSLRRVQGVLRKSMERLRVLAENSPDVIMQFDRNHRHLFVNSQAEMYSHFKVEDFLGKTHAEMGMPEEFCLQCAQALQQVFETGQRHRLELQLPNGLWVDWYLIPEFSPNGEVITVITTSRDISEQKNTEAALQKSRQNLKDAFEVTMLSSWEYLVGEDLLLLNNELQNLLGLSEATHSLSGKEFLQRFILTEEQGKLQYLLRVAAGSDPDLFKEVIDYKLRRHDGMLIHVLSSIRLESDANGAIVRAYGTSQDITQLRLNEQELEEYRSGLEQLVETRTLELRKSEEKLADALRLANLGTWEYDPVAECFFVSDNVLEFFGTSREMEGGNMIPVSRMRAAIFPDDRIKYLKTVKRINESTTPSFTDRVEFRIISKQGDIRHLYLSIQMSKTRNFIKYYGTLQDISSIRNTEQEKDLLNAIVETTSDIVGIAGTDGRLIYLNKAGKEFFGISKDEPLHKKSLNNYSTQHHAKVLSRKELQQADTSGTWSGQNQYMRYDGQQVHVSQVIISHKNREGQVQCYSTILRDMSEQKKIEQDLIFKNTELDTFIYRASHDLRGPIATLMGLNQIVRYEVNEETSLKYFDLYNSQILRLHNITVSLIELTKIKDRTCEIAEVDIREVWQEVVKEISLMPECSEVALDYQIEDLRGFCSDAHLIRVILYNLIENAIRYRRSEVESYAKTEMLLSRETGHLVIKVSDNGIGIDAKLQNKIYNMFFRGTDRSKGPGLGLYILKNAVEKLNGRIQLYSVPYKGTTFKIELPSLSTSQAVLRDYNALPV